MKSIVKLVIISFISLNSFGQKSDSTKVVKEPALIRVISPKDSIKTPDSLNIPKEKLMSMDQELLDSIEYASKKLQRETELKALEQKLAKSREDQLKMNKEIEAAKAEKSKVKSEVEARKAQNAKIESELQKNKEEQDELEKQMEKLQSSQQKVVTPAVKTEKMEVIEKIERVPVQTSVIEPVKIIPPTDGVTQRVAAFEKEMSEVTMQDLETKSKQFFKKQDAAPAVFLIEGFLFQGVSVFLEGKQKSVEKGWKQYLKESNSIKLRSRKAKGWLNKKKTPYFKATEIKLTNVTHRVGDLLTVFQKENGLIKMTVIYKLGYNTSVNKENFPEANLRLINYVEQFSQVNFQEYYGHNIKTLQRSIKSVDKEIKKESKVLRKQERKYKKYVKKNSEDNFQQLSIDVQKKLISTLRAERNKYEFTIMQYKNRNSEIRTKQLVK